MSHSHSLKIYRRRWHLVVTFAVIFLPFLFIFGFTKYAGIQTSTVFIDLGASLLRVFSAYAASVFLAMILVLLINGRRFENFFLPVLDVLQSFPAFALLPILTVWFGPGNLAAIFFLIATMLWPILFSALSSIRMERKDLEEAAVIFGARGTKKLISFTLPMALPGLVMGSIVGLGEGWEAIVGAEIIGVTPGIGNFLNTAAVKGEYQILAFGIIALLLFLFTLNKLIWLPLLKRSHDYSHE
ncbi:MAG: ABC transporter permease subunit [Candidatus Niyogibacteria bacterium]|nr:ABC transporter permease subunit [Candidatus Niyogibacteria bacterium]